MNNMKKILNEWRSFLKESSKPKHNSVAARLNKLVKTLEGSKKEIDVYKLGAIRIVLFLSGEGEDLCDYVKLYPSMLMNHCDRLLYKLLPDFDALGTISDEYFSVSEAVEGTSPSVPIIRLNPSFFPYPEVFFDDEEEMHIKIQTLKNMIDNLDCGFKIFQDHEEPTQKYDKDRKYRGAGYGQAGFSIPPGMNNAETDEFVKNYLKWKEYTEYIVNTLRPSDLGTVVWAKETDARKPIDIKNNLLKSKMGSVHSRTPKPLSYEAPLPDDYYDKMAEYMSKMPPVFEYLANAWERSFSRITDELSLKHAQREARSAREAAEHFKASAKALKSLISNPVQKMDLYINGNVYGIQRVAAYIIYLDNKIKAHESEMLASGKKINKHLIDKLSQQIRESFKNIKRMEKEIKQYEEQKPGSVSLEDLIAAARGGDKEAAKQAKEMAQKEQDELTKQNDPEDKQRIRELIQIAREMRRLSR